jgi:hypothetical protein
LSARVAHACRQDKGLKYLHYVDSAAKFPVRDGLEDLPERIELSLVSEVATKNCAPPPRTDGHDHLSPVSPLVASPLSFSLLTNEGSLADQIAPDASRWADWTDGLNMLRRDSGHVASQETAGFIQALTDIGLKIKLLGACCPSRPTAAVFPVLTASAQICPATRSRFPRVLTQARRRSTATSTSRTSTTRNSTCSPVVSCVCLAAAVPRPRPAPVDLRYPPFSPSSSHCTSFLPGCISGL